MPSPPSILQTKQAHFDEALKIDPRCRRNHYCQGLIGLAKGDTEKAQTSFQEVINCRPQSSEEGDVGDFFLRESQEALKVLRKSSKGVDTGT